MTKARDLGDNAQNTKPKVINAKGDLIVGTGSDAADRLAVSDNGSTLVADSSATTGLRWQTPKTVNGILNSDMSIWQRGTSLTPSSNNGTYTADRWYTSRGSNTSVTVSRQNTNDTTNLPFIQYCARVQRTASSTTTSDVEFAQSLESAQSKFYVGKTVTISGYIRRGTNFSATSNALLFSLIEGTGTDQNLLNGGFTGNNTVAGSTVTLTTTWQRFSVSGTVATTTTQLALRARYTPTGTAGADDWFEITGVQLEVGSVATPFQTATGTLAGELQAAQRYYYVAADGANKTICMAAAYSTNNAYGVMPFKVSMRTAPTLVQTTGTDFYTLVGGNTSDGFDSFASITNAHSESCRLDVTSGIASTQLGAYWFIAASASARLAFSAEL